MLFSLLILGKTVHKCKFCGLEVRLQGNMRDHVRTHTGEKPFECETCGKRFGSQTNYNLHIKCHSVDRPFVCDICGFAFKIKKQLKLHVQRHTSSGSKICQHCGQAFYSSTELRNHLLRHSDEKQFKCEICDKTFTQPSSLKRHRFVHTGDGHHQCHYCGAVFNRRDYFRSHLIKKHAVSEDAVDVLVPNLQPGRKLRKSDSAVTQKETSEEVPLVPVNGSGGEPLYIRIDDKNYAVQYLNASNDAHVVYCETGDTVVASQPGTELETVDNVQFITEESFNSLEHDFVNSQGVGEITFTIVSNVASEDQCT